MKDINLFRTKDSIFLKKIISKEEVSLDDDCDGYFICALEKEVRRIIDSVKGKNKLIAVEGRDNAFNRRIIEKLKIDYLVSPEKGIRRSSLKQRDSGLNHVLANEANKKGVGILVNLSEISQLDSSGKVERIERIIQNINICKKAGCKIGVVSFSENKSNLFFERERTSFGVTLGMSTKQLNDSKIFNKNL
jgi:RNase P/RNase MRP subunit p30